MADLVSYALTTVADVKETLGIDSGDTSKDNLIKRKINLATEMIEGYCNLSPGHHFKEATYTNEELDASNTDKLLLNMAPVTAFTSIQRRESTLNEDDWETLDTEDYFTDNNAGIVESSYTLGGRFNRFRVTYTAGYATIPADLSEAAATLAAHLVTNATVGAGIQSIREGQRQVTYAVNQQSESLIDSLGLDNVLDRYVRFSVVSDA